MVDATTPLNFTTLPPEFELKFVPEIVTEVPMSPLAGLKPEIDINEAVTVKSMALVPTCPSTETVILPDLLAALTSRCLHCFFNLFIFRQLF